MAFSQKERIPFIFHIKNSKLKNEIEMKTSHKLFRMLCKSVLFDHEMSISIVIDEASSVVSGLFCIQEKELHRY